MDHAANLALFLVEKTGTCLGFWKGRLTAQEQRALFGKFLGKGKIAINGADESLKHIVKVGFGMDFDITHNISWKNL